ncbi:MAG: TIGR03960 family B12-binding radical SAM protein [Deltaproteobacteria bacterium]|nr:TIGR03960 family B12-binding radical SAM protein [Deltaproteobacteria bacterium]
MTRDALTDQPWFADIIRPSRYLGNEPNVRRKPRLEVDLHVGLAFPDVYEVGMSHQGLKILYRILNDAGGIAAERVFCPWVDLEAALREHGRPLETLESGTPLAELDVLGFSLQHELCYTNVLTMLDLAGIPFAASHRNKSHPLVIAGGPACFNPEPVAGIFDAFLIGDGEEATLEICERVRRAIRTGTAREDLLADLTSIQGVYIPSFFEPVYGRDGVLEKITPLRPGYEVVRKALVPDLGPFPSPADPVVPFSEPVHDRLAVEICRGCTRGCRFCQAGMIYRPARERAPDEILEIVRRGLAGTGYEDVSLLSLSTGDYSAIGPLLTALMDRQSRDRISVSLPSLRIDSLDEAWFEQIKRVRKTGFTLAPEAGSDRLRRVINKSLTNSGILQAARKVYGAGWKLIKLYFMVGLPGETEEDLQAVVRLSREVARLAGGRGKRPRLHVSVAAFVPKAHTPFMWEPQITLEESRRRMHLIRDGLRDRRIRVKWNAPEMSRLEGVFSRGDRRLLPALVRAWESGARFDAWGEQYRMEIWEEAFRAEGIDVDDHLTRRRSEEETLPWDHIQTGVKKSYLLRERRRAEREAFTPDCRIQCLECGVCDHERVDPVIQEPDRTLPPADTSEPEPEQGRTFLLTFSKTGGSRYLGHLELARAFNRALRRVGLFPAHTGGFHPTPKVSFTSPLPVGTESLQETVRVELRDPPSPVEIRQRLNRALPEGLRILLVEDVTSLKKRNRLLETRYSITSREEGFDQAAARRFLGAGEHVIVKTTPKGKERAVDARALVRDIQCPSPDTVELALLHPPGPSLKPGDIVREIFGLTDAQAISLKILKTKQILG